MLFATNRVLQEPPSPSRVIGPDTRFPRSVNFDINNNQAQQSIYFCRRDGKDSYTEIGHRAFFNALNEDTAEEILFYIHGYSNLPEPTIFGRTQELQGLFDNLQGKRIRVVPLIWPCDNDFGPLQDYFDDQIAADSSDMAFMRFFEWYFHWIDEQGSSTPKPFSKNLNILTHSMGARVLRGALNRSVQYFQLNGFPLIFRNIFLSAADLVNEALENNQTGQWIPHSTRNVAVYYASDDWALRSSTLINLRNLIASRRLGQHGPENFDAVPNNVYAFDCGDFNNKLDPAGHGYFAGDGNGNPGLVLRHMHASIQQGRILIPSNQRDVILDERIFNSQQ